MIKEKNHVEEGFEICKTLLHTMNFINYRVKNVKIHLNCNSLKCIYLTFLAFEPMEQILKYDPSSHIRNTFPAGNKCVRIFKSKLSLSPPPFSEI
jgi:hypothetical protein